MFGDCGEAVRAAASRSNAAIANRLSLISNPQSLSLIPILNPYPESPRAQAILEPASVFPAAAAQVLYPSAHHALNFVGLGHNRCALLRRDPARLLHSPKP